ncbi:MAG TPA: glycosyltransferase [Propylenella sp.]|nr:glycosyltransferase [Propylenella sp.]
MPSSSRPRTILQVIPALDTGGAERTTIDIAAALAARGDRPLVASAGGRLEGELLAVGGILIRVKIGSKNPAVMAANALRLARIARRDTVDLIHARSRAPAWAALAACRATGLPFVTTYHGIYGERGAAKRFYNSVMARGEAVIANSAYTAQLIAHRYKTDPGRIVIIYRGTDVMAFHPDAVAPNRREAIRRQWGLNGSERVVLNLARLTGWKGQRVLIEAAATPPLVDHRELVFVLAGDTQGREAYRRELESRIAARGLSARVRIVGHCADVPAALAVADVAVIASTEPEAFGRAAVEAQAMGVPIVVTNLGAAAETVLAPPQVAAEVRTGWHVPPADPEALAQALAAALALHPAERQALAGRSREHAERFSVEGMQAATLAVYDRILDVS